MKKYWTRILIPVIHITYPWIINMLAVEVREVIRRLQDGARKQTLFNGRKRNRGMHGCVWLSLLARAGFFLPVTKKNSCLKLIDFVYSLDASVKKKSEKKSITFSQAWKENPRKMAHGFLPFFRKVYIKIQ